MKKKIIIILCLITIISLGLFTFAKANFSIRDEIVQGVIDKIYNLIMPSIGSGGEQVEPITSSSAVSGGVGVTYITNQTNDFAIGGSDSNAALWFDESAGDLKISGTQILLDSAGTASIISDRVGTSNYSSFILTSAGTDQWSMQLRNDASNDFHLRDVVNGRTLILGQKSTGNVGINTTTPQTNLDIKGIMSVYPAGTATTTCSTLIEGAFMYSTGTRGFYGCNGSVWTQL